MVWSDYSGFLCPHKVELAQPRRLLNAERRWRVILNDGHNFQQTVRLETCLKVSGQGGIHKLRRQARGRGFSQMPMLQHKLM